VPVVTVALLLGFAGAGCTRSTGDTRRGDIAVRVPNVVGMEYADARVALEQQGFKVFRRNRLGDDVTGVVRQDPEPDSPAEPGSSVTIVVVSSPRTDQPDAPAADGSWARGVVLGPSFDWVQGGTVTLVNSAMVSPPLFVVIVHAPQGYYALGLRGVRPCPRGNSGSGEGQSVDERTGDVVFHCANGDVWARFDWFGRSIPGTPARAALPAFKVLPKADGRLVVTRQPPPMPLANYWQVP